MVSTHDRPCSHCPGRGLAGAIGIGAAAGVAAAVGVMFGRNAPDTRLIGIEYIISEERFRGLPEDEKRLWHSHHHEVKSGILVAPGIPYLAEHAWAELRKPAITAG